MRPLAFLLALFLFASSGFAGQTKVACVGDSITFGVGAGKGWDYPSQLQRMLGTDSYLVRNFGVSGATLLRHGDKPYEKQPAFKAAVDFKPDILVIMLGTNDTKSWNWWPYPGQFEPDYRWLVSQFADTNPSNIFVSRPTWVSGTNRFCIDESVIQMEIPIIDKIAADMHLREIDMHAALLGHPEALKDTVHPTAAGATLMAKAAYKAITGKDFQGIVPPPPPTPTPSPAPSATP